jgi:hypothetical protein
MKFDWQNRVKRYDLRMVMLEQESSEADLKARAADWAARQRELREIEWRITREGLLKVEELLRQPKLSTESRRRSSTVVFALTRPRKHWIKQKN